MDVIKDKDRLYRLIVGQLQYDGYVQVSKNLMQQVRPGQGIAPSDKLMKIFQAGLKQIKLEEEAEEKSKLHSAGDEGLDLGVFISLSFYSERFRLSFNNFY